MSERDRKPRGGVDEEERTRARMAREVSRLEGQGEKLIGGGGFPAGTPAEEDDAIEIWGRRIGRGLGYAFALYLIWHLLSTYVLK